MPFRPPASVLTLAPNMIHDATTSGPSCGPALLCPARHAPDVLTAARQPTTHHPPPLACPCPHCPQTIQPAEIQYPGPFRPHVAHGASVPRSPRTDRDIQRARAAHLRVLPPLARPPASQPASRNCMPSSPRQATVPHTRLLSRRPGALSLRTALIARPREPPKTPYHSWPDCNRRPCIHSPG